MKQKWIDAYMDTADRFAQLSSALRLKVGAVIVKENRIISIGYNGTPSGWDNTCEDFIYDEPGVDRNDGDHPYILKTKDVVIHAEMNAISKLAASVESGKGADMFLTHAPCVHCAKAIYGAGISTVYFKRFYRGSEGLEFLAAVRVPTIHTHK